MQNYVGNYGMGNQGEETPDEGEALGRRQGLC